MAQLQLRIVFQLLTDQSILASPVGASAGYIGPPPHSHAFGRYPFDLHAMIPPNFSC